jgi:hypothetical protein
MDWLDILLFAGIVVVLTGIGFVGAIEGWRQWSDNLGGALGCCGG